jgi:hypothetical protein
MAVLRRPLRVVNRHYRLNCPFPTFSVRFLKKSGNRQIEYINIQFAIGIAFARLRELPSIARKNRKREDSDRTRARWSVNEHLAGELNER